MSYRRRFQSDQNLNHQIKNATKKIKNYNFLRNLRYFSQFCRFRKYAKKMPSEFFYQKKNILKSARQDDSPHMLPLK